MKDQFKRLVSGEDISLKELLQPLQIVKPHLKKMGIITIALLVLFGVIGKLAQKITPKEYVAKCILMTDQAPPAAGAASSSLAAIAALAGGGNNAAGNSEGSDFYQLILSNKPFLVELAVKPLVFNHEGSRTTLYEYFWKEPKKDAITEFWARLTSLMSRGSKEERPVDKKELQSLQKRIQTDSATKSFINSVYITELPAEQKKIIGILQSRIKFEQTGKLITLSVRMPEARLSAEATKLVLNLLIEYATRFKVGKQLENVRFLEARTAEAEQKYRQSQLRVASFKDNNYNVVFESVQSKEKQLENEFVLYSGIYNQLVGQLEQARIQLKKDTPLFSVVEPVYIPEETAPDGSIFTGYLIKGFLFSILINLFVVVWVFRKHKKTKQVITTTA